MKYINIGLKVILLISMMIFGFQLSQVVGYQSLIALRSSSFWIVSLIISLLTATQYHIMTIIGALLDALGILGVSIIVLILILMIDDKNRRDWICWIGYYFVGLVVVVCSLLLWYSNNYYDNRLFFMIQLCGWFFMIYYGLGLVYLIKKNWKMW